MGFNTFVLKLLPMKNLKNKESFAKIIQHFEDKFTFEAEKDIKSKPLIYILGIFTELGSSLVLMAIFVILSIIFGFSFFYTVVPIYLCQLGVVELIKHWFKKPRPKCNNHKSIFGIKATSGSFPSGHSSNVFATAFLLSNFFRLDITYTAIFFAVAALVSFTRILLGKHYILDLIGGALIGLFVTFGASILWILIAIKIVN